MSGKIPLRIEQALDLVLALPAHRSGNQNHAKFGHMLIEEYFIKLRSDYKEDENAYIYLTHLFTAVASAVRAFSVQRDIFQTKWNTLCAVKNSIINRANKMEKYSPFNGVNGKLISLFISLSSSGIITKPRINNVQDILIFVYLVPIFFVIAMFIFDFVLDLYRDKLIRKAEKTLNQNVVEIWQEENHAQYKLILKNFLLIAIEIHKRHYPNEEIFEEDIDKLSKEELEQYLDKIIEKHLAF
ncbi:hypothetical protein [Zhaonella formicivorans]|uniref:hypothetical protein n=1 Tax=Zhaonella formicivorans TaxID=2528593 RepID=UPI0010D3671B|nr:hypothetical protein [Zhaonella formicivorans]